MSAVRDVMQRGPASIGPHTSLARASASLRMVTAGVLAISSGPLITGIITDRDIVKAIADGMDLNSVEVADLAAEVPTVEASDDVAVVWRHIETSGASGAVVLEQGRPVGIVTERDLKFALLGDDMGGFQEHATVTFDVRTPIIPGTIVARDSRVARILLGRKPYGRPMVFARVLVLILSLIAVLFLLATVLLMAFDGDVTPLVAAVVAPMLAVGIPLGLRAAHGRWAQQ